MDPAPFVRELQSRPFRGEVHAELPVRQQFALGASCPALVVFPGAPEDVACVLGLACERRAAVVAWGGGARQRQVPAPRQYDIAVVLTHLNRVVLYDPAELTITVQAGCTAGELAQLLAAHRQWAPLDVALPQATTVGGIVASAAVGLEYAHRGSLRDALLGIGFATAAGTVVHGGGRVVKNVAGYDLMRLLAGSWGTLALVTDVTFKVFPAPPARTTVRIAARSFREAVALSLDCQAEVPAPAVSVALHAPAGGEGADGQRTGATVLLRYAGVAGEVDAGLAALSARVPARRLHLLAGAEEAQQMAYARDFCLARGTDTWAGGLRLALLPSDVACFAEHLAPELEAMGAAILALPPRGTVYVRFAEVEASVWRRAVAEVRSFVATRRGWAWIDLWPEGWMGDRPPMPNLYWARRVKDVLDPFGILGPGRYWGHW